MSVFIPHSPRRSSNSFQKISDVFFQEEGLPFSQVLPAETMEAVFRKHKSLFGRGAIYSTAIVLWAFLRQVLQCGKMAACQAAVASIIAHRQLLGQPTPTEDTGDYCRARAKLNEHALRELSGIVAENAESESDAKWLIHGRHAKLVDGFTFTMPDTDKNQRQYPQANTQKRGIGFPIARCVAILSLATACVRDLSIGPYSGKETGETALLRQLTQTFKRGDIVVFDRYYWSYMMIAAMQFVLQEWKQLSRGELSADVLTAFVKRMLKGIANCRVADRPGRIEPRVVKRRPKPYKSMMKPRNELRQKLLNS